MIVVGPNPFGPRDFGAITWVPATVPSVTTRPSAAIRKTRPFVAAPNWGFVMPGSGNVPVAVPSVTHNEGMFRPVPSLYANNALEPNDLDAVMPAYTEYVGRSVTSTVPATVPSLR